MSAADYPRLPTSEYAAAILDHHLVIAESRAQVAEIRRELGDVLVRVRTLTCEAGCPCGGLPSYQIEVVR